MQLWRRRKRFWVQRWFLSYNYRAGINIGFGSGEVITWYDRKDRRKYVTKHVDIQGLVETLKENQGLDNVVVLYYCLMREGYEYEKPQVATKR